jgi:hypothetical protein
MASASCAFKCCKVTAAPAKPSTKARSSIGDVVKHRLEDFELETNVLRDAYIAAR